MWISVFFVLLLLFLSAFFSATETAIFSIPEYKIRLISKKGIKGAVLKDLLGNPLKLLITILLSNTIVNVALTLYFRHFNIFFKNQYWNFILHAGIISILIIIFGEFIPKYVGIKKSTFISVTASPIIIFIKYLFFPIVLLLEWIDKAIFKRPKPYLEDKEIQFMVSVAGDRNIINKRQREFTESFFSLKKRTVMEIMIPHSETYTVSDGKNTTDIINELKIHKYTQKMIPVYKGKRDNIVGQLYVKDLLENYHNGKTNLKKIVKRPNFVPETVTLYELLKHFINMSVKSSIVVDEFGGISGIVHIEDLISIFSKSASTQTEKKIFVIDGNTGISEIEKKIGISLPKDNFDTIAGFIIKMLNNLPEYGDKIEYKGYRFTVMKKKRFKVLKVKVEKI